MSEEASAAEPRRASGSQGENENDPDQGERSGPSQRLRRATLAAPLGPPREPTLSPWLRSIALHALAALVIAAAAWLLWLVLLRVGLVSAALAVAVLLAALLTPFLNLVLKIGAPRWLAALTSMLLLIGAPAGAAVLVVQRVRGEFASLGPTLRRAVSDIENWLVTGPLSLDRQQVSDLEDTLLDRLSDLAPAPMSGAMTLLRVLAAVILALFTTFFLLKDGGRMWRWFLSWVPGDRREPVTVAGESAWETLRGYVVGTVLVALVDAVGIGVALFVVGVPFWFSLTLLVFLGSFVPLLGATVSGAIAVLVTLVTQGFTDAVIVLVAVIVVQQVEGNLLQPLIMSRAVALHPVTIIVAVSVGALLLGIIGAVVAVPIVAVLYRVAVELRALRRNPTPSERAAEGSG